MTAPSTRTTSTLSRRSRPLTYVLLLGLALGLSGAGVACTILLAEAAERAGLDFFQAGSSEAILLMVFGISMLTVGLIIGLLVPVVSSRVRRLDPAVVMLLAVLDVGALIITGALISLRHLVDIETDQLFTAMLFLGSAFIWWSNRIVKSARERQASAGK